jgi:hypothetical protein
LVHKAQYCHKILSGLVAGGYLRNRNFHDANIAANLPDRSIA